jgi:hypothetical protein
MGGGGRLILKCISKKQMREWMLCSSGQDSFAGWCEHDSEFLCYIKCIGE